MMKMLLARRYPRSAAFEMHLDTTKVVDDAPDPLWVFGQSWDIPARAPGQSDASYEARIAAWLTEIEAQFLAASIARRDDLVAMTDPGSALPAEGQTFDV